MHRQVPGLVIALALASSAAAATTPQRIVSINLCADQLLLTLAEPRQIASVSWLAADPAESPVAQQAGRFPANQGSVEELLALAPDLILAGRFTGNFTKAFLRRLGYPLLEIAPANSLAEIYANLRTVALAIGRAAHGESVITQMQRRVAAFEAANQPPPRPAIIMQPGGYTVGANSVADELLQLAGFENRAARMGLDRWGSLSLEALLTSGAERLIVASYQAELPSMANQFLHHRVLRRLAERVDLVSVPAVLFACGAPAALEAVAYMRAAAVEQAP
jgi:iron complex transport system substrate-binding protein